MFDQIDRNLLTREQRQTLEVFEQGFKSTFWSLIVERFEQHNERNLAQYDSVLGEQALGLVQGLRRANAEVINLDAVIEREILAATGQDDSEAPEPEEPEFDDGWIS